MCRTTRNVLRLILSLALTTVLASCGSGDSEDDDLYINLYSSPVFGEHSLVLKDDADGTLRAWGANGYGQLGLGDRKDKTSPQTVAPQDGDTGFTQVSIGGAHGVAIGNNGNVYAWGHNINGQLGDNTNTTRATPDQVLGIGGLLPLTGVTAVAAGGRHTLALTTTGTVLAWGSNAQGQLGNGTKESSKIPVLVTGLSNVVIVKIAAGGEFSLALDAQGAVWAWGSNSTGQLGDGTTTTSLVPKQVMKRSEVNGIESYGEPLTDITEIAAGGSHALAIMNDGTIWAWGYNVFGQLGDDSTTTRKGAVAVLMPTAESVASSIAAGLDHSLAVIGIGGVNYVYAWGYNKSGQLGNGGALNTESAFKTPLRVQVKEGSVLTDLVGIESVIAGGYHSMARASTPVNTLYTWGKNSKGQLGDGGRVSRSHAALVTGF